MAKIKLLVLPKYGLRGASSRLRFYQYLPSLESQGFDCTVSSLFDDDYVARRSKSKGSATKAAGISNLLRALGNRIRQIRDASRYDLVFMHCEAFPYLPPFLENSLQRRKIRYVTDYDDAIFHNYDQHTKPVVRRLLGDKIAKVFAGATCVIAGSPYLYDYACRTNEHVHLLPTVVDLARYRPENRPADRSAEFTVGWIGTFSTAPYLKEIEGPLQSFCQAGEARLLIIGAGRPPLAVEPMEFRAWSEETEVEDCLRFDTGIMPLPDTPWTRGKCGYKLIQYMACALPIIASPVGVNTDIVESGTNGYLATVPSEWQNALEQLKGDSEHAKRLGQAGRTKVEQEYSLAVTAPRLAKILRESV